MQISMFNEDKLSSEPFMSYRGSKRRVSRTLFRCIPPKVNQMVSPFIGSGGFELYTAASGIKVFAYDRHIGIVRLWQQMLSDAGGVCRKVLEDFPGDVDLLSSMIKTGKVYDVDDDIEFASIAWKIAKFSFNGNFMKNLWMHNSRSVEQIDKKFRSFFNPDVWDKWGNSNLSVEELEWEDTLEKHPNEFLYCDPPYIGLEQYYGVYGEKESFNHVKFSEAMIARDNGWIISYIDNPLLRDLYRDFEIVKMKWHQSAVAAIGKRKGDANDEIIIIKPPAVNPYSMLRTCDAD